MLRHSDTRWKCKAPLRSEAESWGWRWHAESEEWARKGGVQVAKVRESQHNETKECSTAQLNKHCRLGAVTMQRIQSNIHVVFFAVVKNNIFAFLLYLRKQCLFLRSAACICPARCWGVHCCAASVRQPHVHQPHTLKSPNGTGHVTVCFGQLSHEMTAFGKHFTCCYFHLLHSGAKSSDEFP